MVEGRYYPPSSLTTVVIDKQRSAYKGPWALALLFLKFRSPNLVNGGRESISLVFDMNVLFEKYVVYLCNRYKADLGLRQIMPQHNAIIYDQAWSDNPKEAVSTAQSSKIDLVGETLEGKFLVFDMKYKRVSWNKRSLNLSVDDLYQIFTYSHLKREPNEEVPTALLYPKDEVPFSVRLQNNVKGIKWHAFSLDLHVDLRSSEETLVGSLKRAIDFMQSVVV